MGDVAALTWPLTRPGGLLPLPANGARRCLFGPVDHKETKVLLEQQMGKIMEQDKLRWNFDFQTGRPLPGGRYVWEKVTADPKDADSNGGSENQTAEEENSAKREEQTHITDFMRKRKSSSQKESVTLHPKTRRRSST